MTSTIDTYKTVPFRNGRTRYIDAGAGDPLVLLLISSIEGGADDYLASLDTLAAHFRVLVGMLNYTIESITPDDKVREWIEKVAGGWGVDVERLVQEKLAKIHQPGFAEAFATIMRTIGAPSNREHYAVSHRLPHLHIPVLILIGERDQAAMALKDQVMAAAPPVELKIIPSGHRVHIEDPELFAATVRDYLH